MGGFTVVRSPYALQQFDKGGTALLELEGMFLEAFRGTGQGDVSSPLNWDAAFDALMVALSRVDDKAFITRH